MSIQRSFNILRQNIASIASRGRGALSSKIMARMNAQYERILGSPAPGSNVQRWKGHDHNLHGGRPLSRGTIYCFDSPGANVDILIEGTDLAYDVYHRIVPDRPLGYFKPTASLDDGSKRLFVRLVYKVAFHAGGGNYNIDFRIFNNATQSFTLEQSDTIAPGDTNTLLFVNLPFRPGVYNGVSIEISAPARTAIEIEHMLIQEVASFSEPSQDGSVFSSIGRP